MRKRVDAQRKYGHQSKNLNEAEKKRRNSRGIEVMGKIMSQNTVQRGFDYRD